MAARPRRQDWQVLGLEPGADPTRVRRSYLERKALYASESVASYNLLEDEERAALLRRIEEAYQRIVGEPPPTTRAQDRSENLPEPPAGPPPPVEAEPGAHLRHLRLSHGFLLTQVADDIKVRASLLEMIEHEQFESLPAPVYVRGFVIQYARLLRAPDPENLASAYLAKMNSDLAGE